MEPSLLSSIIGIIVVSAIMFFVYRYANGNWSVSELKESEYLNWTNRYGKTIKKGIVIISIIYGILMLIQISSLIYK